LRLAARRPATRPIPIPSSVSIRPLSLVQPSATLIYLRGSTRNWGPKKETSCRHVVCRRARLLAYGGYWEYS
jgi:hypothetical protein